MEYETKPNLQSRPARADVRVLPRKKPYTARLEPGLHLGYRKPVSGGPGKWLALLADGKSGQIPRPLGTADDMPLTANGIAVLSFAQAAAKARIEAIKHANGVDAVEDPLTIDKVLLAYSKHLAAHGRARQNAHMPRVHLTKFLLAMRADQVGSGQFKRWRDDLVADGKRKRSTVNRIIKPLIAALNEAAKHDTRIAANAKAWTDGLEKLDEGSTARNAYLSPEQVSAVVTAAYAVSPEFGLFVHVHAETGNRSSQIARLTVGDLQPTLHGYRLMMPPSYKGDGGLKRVMPVPIGKGLAARLVAAAAGRADHALLLVRADERAWGKSDQRYPFKQAAKAAGVPGVTIYWLRHSSIKRMLLDRVPVKVVADMHSTGTAQIEKHYAADILDHSDSVIRKGLVDFSPQADDGLLKTA